jgi:transcriptional regulator with XRE-family HTH domain
MRTNSKTKLETDLGVGLGREIAKRRKACGLTQDDLAGMVDVDAETISRFERGAVLPSLTRLAQIATALKTGLGDLLAASSDLPSDQTQRITTLMEKMRPDQRGLLLGIAALMVQESEGN